MRFSTLFNLKFLKWLKWIFGLCFILLIGLSLFINFKKNELSKTLLLEVNSILKGNFYVQSIEVGSLFSYPELDLHLRNIIFKNDKSNSVNEDVVLDIPSARCHVNLSDFLDNVYIIKHLEIQDAQLFIEKDQNGNMVIAEAFSLMNNETEGNDEPSTLKVQIDAIEISSLQILIKDEGTNLEFPLHIEKAVGDFNYFQDRIQGVLELHLNPQEQQNTSSLISVQVPVSSNLGYTIDLQNRLVDVRTSSFLFGKNNYQLDVQYNYSKQSSVNVSLKSNNSGIWFDSVFDMETDSINNQNKTFGLKGKGYLQSKIYCDLSSNKPILNATKASLVLKGKALNIEGMDLDLLIDNFKKTQSFNFTDVGAVLFAGPAGLAVTKGGDFARLAFLEAGDTTYVSNFVANWKLKNGILRTQDVALSTTNNLVASNGWYNINNDSLQFKFSIIDKKYCELASQYIYGSYNDVKYGEIKLLKTVLGPINSFLKNIGLMSCERVYDGSLKHPNAQNNKK